MGRQKSHWQFSSTSPHLDAHTRSISGTARTTRYLSSVRASRSLAHLRTRRNQGHTRSLHPLQTAMRNRKPFAARPELLALSDGARSSCRAKKSTITMQSATERVRARQSDLGLAAGSELCDCAIHRQRDQFDTQVAATGLRIVSATSLVGFRAEWDGALLRFRVRAAQPELPPHPASAGRCRRPSSDRSCCGASRPASRAAARRPR